MHINCDFKLNIKSIEEFARIMIPEISDDELFITHTVTNNNINIKAYQNNLKADFAYKAIPDKIDDQLQTMIKIILLKLYNKNYSWGSLMGVRPTKVLKRLLETCNYSEAKTILSQFYLVSNEKIKLLYDVVKNEKNLIDQNKINCYIGIPYCPTKCTYCSFASYEINSGVGRYYQQFVDTLIKEINIVGKNLKEKHKIIDSIYIGGGTPSILDEINLEKILSQINSCFDLSYLQEFTFEAGREDTLNTKKLNILKKYNINRISLNPQTFNTKTLEKINRKFNKKHFDDMFNYTKKLDFIVNMDFIIGLTEENTQDILNTLDEIKNYDIENLTIHFLAFKRASNLFKISQNREKINKKIITNKINEIVKLKKMKPYYLYRQKNIEEWGENTGYCKDGFESIFNIAMIEEKQQTIGLGGGAITKIITKDKNNRNYIERIINPKDPALYIKEMITRTKEKFKKLK